MKQTAVEWLINQYRELIIDAQINDTYFKIIDKKREEIFEQAKAMEKEQKKDAFSAGQEQAIAESWLYDDVHPRVEEKAFMTFEQYYNETYETKTIK